MSLLWIIVLSIGGLFLVCLFLVIAPTIILNRLLRQEDDKYWRDQSISLSEDRLAIALAHLRAAELFLNGARSDLAKLAIVMALQTTKPPEAMAVRRIVEQIMRQSEETDPSSRPNPLLVYRQPPFRAPLVE